MRSGSPRPARKQKAAQTSPTTGGFLLDLGPRRSFIWVQVVAAARVFFVGGGPRRDVRRRLRRRQRAETRACPATKVAPESGRRRCPSEGVTGRQRRVDTKVGTCAEGSSQTRPEARQAASPIFKSGPSLHRAALPSHGDPWCACAPQCALKRFKFPRARRSRNSRQTAWLKRSRRPDSNRGPLHYE
jgi:hypothetical protein